MVLAFAVLGVALMYAVFVASNGPTLAGHPVARVLDSAQIVRALKKEPVNGWANVYLGTITRLGEQVEEKSRALTERDQTIAELEQAVRRQSLEIDRLRDHVAILVENNAIRVTAFADQCERELSAKRNAERTLALWNTDECATPVVLTPALEAAGYSAYDFDEVTELDAPSVSADTIRERVDF